MQEENQNAALQKEAEVQEVMLTSAGRFSPFMRTFLAVQPEQSGTKLLPLK